MIICVILFLFLAAMGVLALFAVAMSGKISRRDDSES